LNGTQAAQVIREVKLTPEGTLRPETRTELVNQARSTLHTGWDGAQQAVSALQRAAAMLPDTLTARGTVAVPNVTVTPQVQVHVSARERGGLDEALRSQAALSGSQRSAAQRGTSS
jgi:tellurite resistance protein